jgi:hypothetical protein
MVVAADQEVFDFAKVIELGGGIDAVLEVGVVAAVAAMLAGAEDEADLAGGDHVGPVIDAAFAGLLDDIDAHGIAGCAQEDQDQEKGEEFSHDWQVTGLRPGLFFNRRFTQIFADL